MKFFKIILIFNLIACGASDDYVKRDNVKANKKILVYRIEDITAEFIPYLTDFPVDIFHTQIYFEKLSDEKTTAGVCFLDTKIIHINEKLWKSDRWTEEQKKQLIWHEYGHCELGLSHNDSHTNNIPNSIMRSWMMNKYELFRMNFNAKIDDFTEKFIITTPISLPNL